MSQKVLIVDDEPNLLQSIRRGLRGNFELDVAEGGLAGLKQIRNEGPYAVVISDMRMPQVSGLQVLSEAKRVSPDTVRVMLTGNNDQKTATDAVNDGEVFRFLNKPCPIDELSETIHAAIRQYDRVTTERAILSKTLTGSVGLIAEILSMVNPAAFGRAGRLRQLAKRLCEKLQVEDAWQIEVAAMLSQVGCVAVPETILQKAASGKVLSNEENRALESQAKIGHQLVSKIPRLEWVAEMIGKQAERPTDLASFPGLGPHSDRAAKTEFGAYILRLLIDFDRHAEKLSMLDAIHILMEENPPSHPKELLDALAELTVGRIESRRVNVHELRERMILDENVTTNQGDVLIAKGHEVTSSLIQRLWAFNRTAAGVRQPIRVLCHALDSKEASAES